jgi:hypothetical protein
MKFGHFLQKLFCWYLSGNNFCKKSLQFHMRDKNNFPAGFLI